MKYSGLVQYNPNEYTNDTFFTKEAFISPYNAKYEALREFYSSIKYSLSL